MCAYKLDLEREIKKALSQLDQKMEQLNTEGGTKSPNFLKQWSEIMALRQSIQAKQQRVNGIGKTRPFLPKFVSLDQYTKR